MGFATPQKHDRFFENRSGLPASVPGSYNKAMTRRFAILLHTGQGLPHYDLLLESSDAPAGLLATWQFAAAPLEVAAGESLPCQKLPDHRRAYLEYEGPISGGRGEVRCIAAGEYTLLEQREDVWCIELPAGSTPVKIRLHCKGEGTPHAWTATREA